MIEDTWGRISGKVVIQGKVARGAPQVISPISSKDVA